MYIYKGLVLSIASKYIYLTREYDQEKPQSQNNDKFKAPRERDTEHSQPQHN